MDKLAHNRLSEKSLQALLPPRHSIVWKLAGWFLLCITLLLGVNWLLNNFALESYYRRQKSDAVQMAFTEVNSLFSQDYTANLEIIDLTLDSLANNDGISSTIWAGSRLIARYRAEGTQAIPVRPTKTYLPGSCEVTVVQDTKLKTSFITLTGALSNGFPIEMRTSVEGIKESVGITNQFLLISGAVTLLVSLLLIFFFSRRVHPGPIPGVVRVRAAWRAWTSRTGTPAAAGMNWPIWGRASTPCPSPWSAPFPT